MDKQTAKLWALQDRHVGDRQRLFHTVARSIDANKVLYPGSYVDIAPSMVFDDVTYVDSDKRFPKFFGDEDGVREIIDGQREDDSKYKLRAIHADYTSDLDVRDRSVDLLISLYAGFVSEHCTRHLKVGGSLLVNGSHGDASMASIDYRYELTGVITARDNKYLFATTNLASYFMPKKDEEVTVDRLHELGRGVPYKKSAFAYLFTRTG